jgi:hypothetical protein
MVTTIYAAFGGAGAGVFVAGLWALLSDWRKRNGGKSQEVDAPDGSKPPGPPVTERKGSDEGELNPEEQLQLHPEVIAAIRFLGRREK